MRTVFFGWLGFFLGIQSNLKMKQKKVLGVSTIIRMITWCGKDTGLEITVGQRTMSGLIVDLTGQTFVLPVMLTGQNSIVLKMK